MSHIQKYDKKNIEKKIERMPGMLVAGLITIGSIFVLSIGITFNIKIDIIENPEE